MSYRFRITFATQRSLSFVSVLDLGRVWERSLRRAGVPLKYSQGFNPRPKLQFALPLPVGCAGAAEWLEVWLEEDWSPEDLAQALRGQTPEDLAVLAVEALAADAPGVSEGLWAADYRVWLQSVPPEDVAARCAALLVAESLPRVRGEKAYDLRLLILELAPCPECVWMRLSARPGATGRPDEVIAALGFADQVQRYVRERLVRA